MATRRDFTTDGDEQYLISPDCAAGKCSACTGDAWDNRGDRLDSCDHHCHQGGDDLAQRIANVRSERDRLVA